MSVKILSVDDSPIIRFIAGMAFRPYDCILHEACNGEEGLAIASREKPDLILLDVYMPVMDGLTLLAKLNENPDLKTIPVIMLTAESSRDNVLHVARLGVCDYLVKPFTKEQLLEKAVGVVMLQKKGGTPLPNNNPPRENLNFYELAKHYGLDPIPESVACLTELVAKQESDLDLIAKIIIKDPDLTRRLLRAANPRVARETDYSITTVEGALLRTGMAGVLLLAMTAPLSLALVKTFRTMLGLKLESVNPKSVEPFVGEHILGVAPFSGMAKGQVYLRLNTSDARQVSSRILGLPPVEIANLANVDDAIRELLNIITRNFQSNLCDAGLGCSLRAPSVTRQRDFAVPDMAGSGSERMSFRAGHLLVFVDLTVNRWYDKSEDQ